MPEVDESTGGRIAISAIPEEPTPAEYMRLARALSEAEEPSLQPLRIAFLSTANVRFVEPFLVVEGARVGFRVTSYFGPFGQFEQQISGGTSGLRDFSPDVLVLMMRPEDLDPDIVVRFHASRGRRFEELVNGIVDRIEGLVEAFRDWSAAPVLVANFSEPEHPPLGPFDANVAEGLRYAFAAANAKLQQRMSKRSGTFLWDYAGLVASRGVSRWRDPRLWALARVPVSGPNQPALAVHLVRAISAVRTRPAKCLVLDLDNTLWGGVLGDDGPEGIELGDDYPGNVYKSFQRAVLSLVDRGILLAVVSKNERDTVDRVFREHPEMIVRWEHVAASRINWEPKSRNIREIAAELNIGADAMVLFDDNPVERAEVRAHAPEVGVIEVPEDPIRFEQTLWNAHWFDQVSLSEEDRTRAEMYRAERERRAFAGRFESVEEFLTNLCMVSEVGEADPFTIGRITQLVNRTNQFNLTSRRRSQAELEDLSQDPGHVVAWLRVRDRFGDQGLVAVGILKREGREGRIDTFLMSCRMMNRRVEEALLAYLAEHARRWGCDRLVGEYFPTQKNGPVKGFYPRLGFREDGALEDRGRRFVLELDRQDPCWPDVIRREESEEGSVQAAPDSRGPEPSDPEEGTKAARPSAGA